jgi:hypothetical protein
MLIVLNTIHNGNGSNSSVSFLDPFLTYLELLRNKHFTSSCYWNIVSIPRHFNDICVFNFLTSGEKVFQGRPCFWWQQSNCSILNYFAGMLDWVALLLRINQNNSLPINEVRVLRRFHHFIVWFASRCRSLLLTPNLLYDTYIARRPRNSKLLT